AAASHGRCPMSAARSRQSRAGWTVVDLRRPRPRQRVRARRSQPRCSALATRSGHLGFVQMLEVCAHVVEALIRHGLKHVTEVITHAHSATYGVIIVSMFFL